MDGCQTQRQAGQGDEHGSESLAALVQRGNEEEKDDRMGSGWMWNGNQNEKTHGMNDFCLRVVLTGCLWKKNISNCMLQVCFCSGHALPSRGPGEYFAFFPTFDLVTLSPSLSLSRSLSLVTCVKDLRPQSVERTCEPCSQWVDECSKTYWSMPGPTTISVFVMHNFCCLQQVDQETQPLEAPVFLPSSRRIRRV